MAFFLVQFLLVLDINPSTLSFAQPPSYKPPENIFNILRVNSPSASHRGWDFTASQRREMPLYPYQCQYPHIVTHIPPKYTHKQTPTSVPTAGEKTTCKSPTAMPTAWLAAQGIGAVMGRRLADGSDQHWLHITPRQQCADDGKFTWARKALLSPSYLH